jgi:hypothetical protein
MSIFRVEEYAKQLARSDSSSRFRLAGCWFHLVLELVDRDSTFLRNVGKLLPDYTPSHLTNQVVLGRNDRLLSFDMIRTAYKTTLPKILILLRMFSLPRKRVYRAVA